jgi:hypothetical protein
MSSLPLISHHLFVAAIGNQDEDRGQRRRAPGPGGGQADGARAISLEVMAEGKAAEGREARVIEAALAPGER